MQYDLPCPDCGGVVIVEEIGGQIAVDTTARDVVAAIDFVVVCEDCHAMNLSREYVDDFEISPKAQSMLAELDDSIKASLLTLIRLKEAEYGIK